MSADPVERCCPSPLWRNLGKVYSQRALGRFTRAAQRGDPRRAAFSLSFSSRYPRGVHQSPCPAHADTRRSLAVSAGSRRFRASREPGITTTTCCCAAKNAGPSVSTRKAGSPISSTTTRSRSRTHMSLTTAQHARPVSSASCRRKLYVAPTDAAEGRDEPAARVVDKARQMCSARQGCALFH